MIRTSMFVVAALCSTISVTGCGSSGDIPSASIAAASSSVGKTYQLSSEPSGAVGVLQVKESVKDGEPVVLVGRIGGGQKPWIDGRAAFLLVDDGVAPTCADEQCEDGCAECALALAEATTLVKFVDDQGKVRATDARQLLGVENFQTVVVKGVASRDKAGNVSVIADGIYIRR